MHLDSRMWPARSVGIAVHITTIISIVLTLFWLCGEYKNRKLGVAVLCSWFISGIYFQNVFIRNSFMQRNNETKTDSCKQAKT